MFIMLAFTQLGAVAIACAEDLSNEDILALTQRAHINVISTNRARRPQLEGLKAQLPRDVICVLVGEAHEGWARLDTLVETAKSYGDVMPVAAQMAIAHEQGQRIADTILEPDASDLTWSAFPMASENWWPFVHAPWWRAAATAIHEGSFDPRERLELVRDLEVTILCQTADVYRAQLELVELGSLRMPRLRRCVVIGESLGSHAEALWLDRVGVPLTYPTTVPSTQQS
jgi:acyl-coenzyme A synthetase/AMP-(fatty) acid ligase